MCRNFMYNTRSPPPYMAPSGILSSGLNAMRGCSRSTNEGKVRRRSLSSSSRSIMSSSLCACAMSLSFRLVTRRRILLACASATLSPLACPSRMRPCSATARSSMETCPRISPFWPRLSAMLRLRWRSLWRRSSTSLVCSLRLCSMRLSRAPASIDPPPPSSPVLRKACSCLVTRRSWNSLVRSTRSSASMSSFWLSHSSS
mmetsp:Transcript_24114/g.75628  ORF Transcript_24114/g.75628 Transcript_24114/m.75628 type:complete len:201 (-) Transcript_24114:695-1297(-)